MDVKFIKIHGFSISLSHIIDIGFAEGEVYITTTERDGDGNRIFHYSGSEAEAIKKWWEERTDVYRII